jgi:tetratricopeptide (TPR) repeat protein
MADPLLEAVALHRAGRLEKAESRYRAILATNPDHPDCLNLLGALAHQRGDHLRAIELISRAIAIQSDRPGYFCNLAAAHLALGRHDKAVAAANRALSLQSHPDAYLNLGLAQLAAQKWQEAESAFRELDRQWPHDPRGPESLGDCYARQGRITDAIAAYQEALHRNPDGGPVRLVLGTMLLNHDDPAAAEFHLRRAVSLLPRSVAALVNLGSCLTRLGRDTEAVQVYQKALCLEPENFNIWVCIGQALLRCGRLTEAEQRFDFVLAKDPVNVDALTGLADVRCEQQRPQDAIPLYERVLRASPKFDAFRGLADACSDSGDAERAKEILREAVERFPSEPEAHTRYAQALSSSGQFDAAIAECRAVLQSQPGNIEALTELAQLLGARLPAHEQDVAEAALTQQASPDALSGLHLALAHVQDGRGNFASASEHLRQGNAMAKSYLESHGRTYLPAAAHQLVDRLIAAFGTDVFARSAGVGLETDQPVFVVGMPRSGTSLVEQILASHPSVFGAGECRFAQLSLQRLPAELGIADDPLDCIAQLSKPAVQACAGWYLDQIRRLDKKGSLRIIDKMPHNFRLLGWLQILFPRAKFIHCRRDLRDVALSCWMTKFRNLSWACDIQFIAVEIKEYLRIMEHWRQTLPQPIMDIDYERLVADQEGESRKMIDWLGLGWDPACLSFHTSKRPVRTASLSQVRQPIYSRSIGRWRHYVETLRPLIEELHLGFD